MMLCVLGSIDVYDTHKLEERTNLNVDPSCDVLNVYHRHAFSELPQFVEVPRDLWDYRNVCQLFATMQYVYGCDVIMGGL